MSNPNLVVLGLYQSMLRHMNRASQDFSENVTEDDFFDVLEASIRHFPELMPAFAEASGLQDPVKHYNAWNQQRGSDSPRAQVRQALLQILHDIFVEKVNELHTYEDKGS